MYSQSDYLEFLKWDSVFDPNYEILEIEQKEGIVKAKISKIDKRIAPDLSILGQQVKFL
jgi:hypothetical protein